MTIYEATHDKVYPAKGKFGEDVLVSAEEKIALFINGNWTYSMHWPEGDGWVERAKEDVKGEMLKVKQRAWELEQAELLLDKIEGEGNVPQTRERRKSCTGFPGSR